MSASAKTRFLAVAFSVLMVTSMCVASVAVGAGSAQAQTQEDGNVLQGGDIETTIQQNSQESQTQRIEQSGSGAGVQEAVQEPGFQKETIISSISQPMAIEFLPDGRALVLKKSGEILIVNVTTGQSSTYMTLSGVDSAGESGLIDITLDPNFEQNRHFYLYYTPNTNRIARFTHQENQGGLTSTASQSSEEIVWENSGQASNGHQGGGLDFGPEGALWLTVGEQFTSNGGQDTSDSYGKIIRVNPDGSIPSNNPYVDDGDSNTLPEVFALGLRNPFTAGWDLQGEYPRFYIGDVGGNEGNDYEEINVVTEQDIQNASQGEVLNFGWNECEGVYDNNNYPNPCPLNNHEPPFWDYEHTSSDVYTDGSIIDGFVYHGDMFPSEYKGAYFFGDQSRDWFKYMTFHDNGSIAEVNTLADEVEGPVDMEEGPDGALYYVRYSYNGPQDLKKITYEDPTDTTPEVQASTTSVSVQNGTTETVDITASDADGDAVSLNASGLPNYASFTDHGNETGTLTLSPDASDVGTDQVTITGEDDDGNQDQVTIGINVYEAGQPSPDDFDGDGILNENDPDDDNDGTPDTEDPFPLDPNDGTTTDPPVNLEFDQNSHPNTILGLGFTGVMNNGDGYEALYDPSEVTIEDSSLTINNVEGYPDNTPSNQVHGYQVGINPPDEPFAVNTTVSGLPEDPQDVQILGLHIGTGDQDNYAKFMMGAEEPRLEFSHEIDGSFTYNSDEEPVPELTGPNDPETQLSIVVYPDQDLAETYYKPEGGEWTFYDDKSIPSEWLDTSDGSGLAVGLQATTNTDSFDATFHNLTVEELDTGAGDDNSPPTADAGSDQTVDEESTVTLDASGSSDSDAGDTLTYDWTQLSGPSVTLSDTTAAQPTFTAPNVSGEQTLTFEVEVSDGQATDTDQVMITVSDTETADSTIANAIAGDDDVIGTDDLQNATFYWQSGDPVPGTGGETIDDTEQLQDLVFHWQNGTQFGENLPPTAEITMPSDGDTFQAGDTVQFEGTASDSEDGTLSGSDLEWKVGFVHNNHVHPKQSGITGDNGSFEATVYPGHDTQDTLGYQIDLTATDSQGATDTDTVIIDPERTNITLQSDPAGIDLELDEAPYTTPHQYNTVIGVEHTLSAPASQCVDGTEYVFDGWANGETATERTVTVPASETSYTAEYSDNGPCDVHSATISVTEGDQNKDTSPWLFQDSVNVTNTGTVPITSVTMDASTAALPDLEAAGMKDGYSGSTSGQTITIDFSGDPIEPGESALGNIDYNHDTSNGVSTTGPPYHQAYEISGLEMAGTTMTVEYDDGVTQITNPFSDGSPGGGVAVADDDVPSAPQIDYNNVSSFDASVLGSPHKAATVSQAQQELHLQGPAGATVRVLRLEGQMNITGTLGDTIGNVDQYIEDPYEANRFYLDKSEQTVTLDAQGEATTTITLTNNTDPTNQDYAGVNYVTAVVEDGDGDTGMISDVAVLEYAPDGDNQPPTADFSYSPSNPTVGEEVTFTSQSSDLDGTISSWAYEIDGAHNHSWHSASVTHTFDTAGDHSVTLTVEDDDGATDVVTKTVSVQDTAVGPNDFDGDGILNENDPDDDNDGADDTVDPFAIDPDNGTTTTPPVSLDFEQNSHPDTIMGVGFTGLMANGSDYQDLYDSKQVTVDNSSITVEDVGPTYPDNSPSNLEYGFQYGVNPPSEPFRVNTTVSGLPENSDAVQVLGMQIGPGDQNHYMKFLIGSSQPKVEFSHEYGDGFVTDSDETPVPGLTGPNDPKTDLSLVVYPSNNTVEAYYQTESGDWTYYGEKTMPQGWLDTSDGSGLAVGLVATSTAGPYDATWHHLTVEPLDDEGDGNSPPTADAGSDQTVDEETTVTLDASGSSDPDGDTLNYNWMQTAGTGVTLSDTTAAQPTFTAPNVSGDEILSFEVEVSDGQTTDTDQVTITVNDTDVSPSDFDGDGILNENDPDDDNDGADDTVDPFAIDPDNGTTTELPVHLDFEQNSHPNTIIGVGFTGLMQNGENYAEMYNESEITVDGSIALDMTAGDANANNDQDNGFQVGFDSPDEPYAVNTTVNGLPGDSGTLCPCGPGIQLGNGDQQNFVKLVLQDNSGDGGIEFGKNENNNYEPGSITTSEVIGTDTEVGLSIVVYPSTNTVEAFYKPEGGDWQSTGITYDIPASWLDSSDGTGTAAGLIGTHGGTEPTEATWDYLHVETIGDTGDENSPPTADAGSDQTVDENDSVMLNASGSSDPDNDELSYNWTQTAGTNVTLSDATVAQPTFTAPNVSGDETLTFEVEVADGNGGAATDSVTVTVQDQDTDPQPSPTDFDGDGIPNNEDSDDDNDGADDTVDPFAIDPDNGTTTSPPVELDFEENSHSNTILGVGFTGMMVNGSDYQDLYDPSQVTVENSALTAPVVTGTYPNNNPSNLQNGFQFGVDTPEEPFAINTTVSGLPEDPAHVENIGIQIGTGNQDDFMKLMIGDEEAATGSEAKVEFSHEYPDSGFSDDQNKTSVAGLAGPDDPKTNLSLVVYPNQGTHGVVEAYYKPEGGDWTFYQSKDIPSDDWLNESDGSGLAVGTIAEAVDVSSDPAYDVSSFDATWHHFSVEKLDGSGDQTSPSSTLEITPSSGTESSTYNTGSFQLENTGETNVESTTIDLSSGAFPDMVFDPNGSAGDQAAKGLEIDSESGDGVGVVSTTDDDVFSQPHNGVDADDGYDVMTIEFTDFDPGETVTFSTDNDPTSIKGATLDSQEAGPVSGFELSRGTVTVDYVNGETHESQLFGDGSSGGSIVSLDGEEEAAPTIVGNASAQQALGTGHHTGWTTTQASQTFEIQHDPSQVGQDVTIVRAEGELELDNVPDYDGSPGYDVEEFEANKAEKVEYKTVTLTSDTDTVSFTLTNSTTDGGYNYLFASVSGENGDPGNVSTVEVIRLKSE